MQTTLQKPQTLSPFFYLLVLLASVLAIGFVFVRGQTESPEFAEAIDNGIAISVPVLSCNNFKLKDFKTPGKWSKQFRKRGYTLDKVKRMIETGTRENFIDPNGKALTRITDPVTKDWIVIDPNTCEIWMVAPSTFLF